MTRLLPALLLVVVACSSSKEEKAPKATGGGSGKSVDREADRKAIDKARSEFAENHSAGDSKRIGASYVPDGVMMTTGQQPVTGQQAITDLMQASYERYYIELKLISEELLFLADDWVVDRGHYTVSVKPKEDGGAARDDAGSYMVLWQRQPDGAWKLARDIDNSWAQSE